MWKPILMLIISQLLLTTAVKGVKGPQPALSRTQRKKEGIAPRKYYKEKRRQIPIHLDVSAISLEDLVDKRPEIKGSPAGRRYRYLFANHPDIKRINLNDPHTVSLSRSLADLSMLRQENPWKSKMAASIRNFIDDAPSIDEARKQLLKDSVKGTRHKSSKQATQRRYIERLTNEDRVKQKKLAAYKYEVEHGISYKKRRKQLQDQSPFLDLPLYYHLGEDGIRMTAWEVEKATRGLGSFYSSPLALTKELGIYLKDKIIPLQEYDAVMAIRGKVVDSTNRKNRRARSKSVDAASSHADSPAASKVEVEEHHQGSHLSQRIDLKDDSRYASHQLDYADSDAGPQLDWKWLHEAIRSPR